MIEQVAQAIFASRRTALPLARWDQLTDAGREQYCREARAAIEAVRDHLVKCADRDNEQAYYAAIEEIEDAIDGPKKRGSHEITTEQMRYVLEMMFKERP